MVVGMVGRRSALSCETFVDALEHTVARVPGRQALSTLDGDSLTWSGYLAQVRRAAAVLERLDVDRGEMVLLLLSNRPEFHVWDAATSRIGAVPVSVYATSAPEQIEHILAVTGARVIVTEQALAERAAPRVPGRAVLVVDHPEGRLAQLLDDTPIGSDARRPVAPDDLLTVIFTSGTTGPAKGVRLTHRNILSMMRAYAEVGELPDGTLLSYLPMAHLAERVASHYIPMLTGASVTCVPDVTGLLGALQQVRPTTFFGVPRVWEKLRLGIQTVLGAGDSSREAAADALARGHGLVDLQAAGTVPPPDLLDRVTRDRAEVFGPVLAALGLDRVAAGYVAAAPSSLDVLRFFHAVGLPLLELWGMTETGAITTANTGTDLRLGTVGRPLPGVQVRVAEDGEVLVRGPMVTPGYLARPGADAETFDADGWLHTGDLGSIDADGYLTIVGRKKELIINAAGKNMSPANIEAAIKAATPLLAHVCVIGDRRPYNVAVAVLDEDVARGAAHRAGLDPDLPVAALADHPLIRAQVDEGIRQGNERLSRVEQVKRHVILPEVWQAGGEELTPTLKLRHGPIAERYADQIEELYR